MKVKSFWLILLKVLGIYLAIKSLEIIPTLLSSFFICINNDDINGKIYVFSLIILSAVFIIVILYLLVFKTEFMVRKFQLEKGFENENLTFNLNKNDTIQTLICLTGAIIFVTGLPFFIQSVFRYYLQSERSIYLFLIQNLHIFINPIIGYLLMVYNKEVVVLINKFSNNKEED